LTCNSTNISANSVSAGCDLTSLCPRFIVRPTLVTRDDQFVQALFCTEYTSRWIHRGYCWALHVTLESPQEQQQLHVIPLRILCVPQFDCGCHGEPHERYVYPRTHTDHAQVTEYYFIRRGHYRVADLYDPRRDGWYWYTYGINLRAYAAYISGILINVVGFAGASVY
jgi:nucleobase:cation symporter-1, NCS1 family